jgi:hypothetical protein
VRNARREGALLIVAWTLASVVYSEAPRRPGPVHWQLGPDFQYIRNPGYNTDRGPVRFWVLRLHLGY